MESHATVSVDQLHPSDGIVLGPWSAFRKENGRYAFHVARPNSCIRCLQQSLHITSKYTQRSSSPSYAELFSLFQYFLWYLLLLPLILPRLTMSGRKAVACVAVWAATQGLWLSEAYNLEFLGQNVYFGLWVRGLIYVLGNCWVLIEIMKAYD